MASKARVTSSDDRLEPVPDHVLSFLMSWMSPRELVLLGSSTCRLRKLSENSPDTWQRFLACKVETYALKVELDVRVLPLYVCAILSRRLSVSVLSRAVVDVGRGIITPMFEMLTLHVGWAWTAPNWAH